MRPLTPLANLADIEAIEATPLDQRIKPRLSYDIIADTAQRHPDRPALRTLLTSDPEADGHITSYGHLVAQMSRFARLLQTMGLTPRDTVAIILPNLPQTHMALWGAQAEALSCMINPLLEPKQMEAILRASDARVLVTLAPVPETDIWPKVESILPNLPQLKTVLTVDPSHIVGGFKGWAARRMTKKVRMPKDVTHQDFETALKSQSGDRLEARRRVTEQTPAALFHTGGTTGTPKLAMQSHVNQAYMAWALSGVAGLQERDTILCGLPLFHVNGAMVTGLAPLSMGAEILIAGPAGYRTPGLVDNFWALIDKHRVASFSAVPTLYARLLDQPLGDHDISSLRYVICGAAPMPRDLFKRFEDVTGLTILEGYGLTEVTCASATNPLLGQRRIGSVGLRLPYQELAVASSIDEDTITFAAPGKTGTLLIRGPAVFLGYRDAQANRGVLLDEGWLNTGDMASIDPDGYVWLKGRAKDIIIRGGHNIDPQVIEEALSSHPDVTMAAAVGQPDADAGELPCAFVTVRDEATVTPAMLLDHAAQEIAERAALPVHIAIVEALPVTTVGKLFKPPLRAKAAIRVIEQLLTDRQIEAQVDVISGTGGGLHVKIKTKSGADSEHVRQALEIFALDVSVSI